MITRNHPQPSGTRSWSWLALLLLSAAFTAVVLAMVYHRARPEGTCDFRDFWENAAHFRQTGEVAADLGVHNYLPFFTVLMAPWSLLPLQTAATLFVLLSLALYAGTTYAVERLLGDGLERHPRRAYLVALGLMLPYAYACAVIGNLGLLLLFLVVASWLLVERGREWEAGVALGLAALIKLIPGLLIVFFLLKRRWRVAGAAAGTVLVLGLGAPLLTTGYERTVADHRAFATRALGAHSAHHTITSDHPPKAHFNNNALPIVLRRLLTPLDGGTDAPLFVNVADWPRGRVFGTYAALLATLGIVSVIVTLRGSRTWPPMDLAGARRVRAQFGTWCCLMLLASPLVWTHYLVLAYWPLAVVADQGERSARANLRATPWGLVALLAWLLGAVALAWPAARAAGMQIASVLILWGVTAHLGSRREA
jgi:hypothetical protein